MFKSDTKHSVMPLIDRDTVRHNHISEGDQDSFYRKQLAPAELSELTDYDFFILRGIDRARSIRSGLNGRDDLRSGLRTCLGIDLPVEPLTSSQRGSNSVWWLGPTEWMLIASSKECKEVELTLRRKLSDEFALVNVSGGFVYLCLKGVAAEVVIRKSSPYNVNIENFPVGKVVGTRFAKTQVTLRRVGDGFEILCRSSFADYLWAWIRDASREFGLEIST